MIDILTHMAKGGRVIHRYTAGGNHWAIDTGSTCYARCTSAVKALIARGYASEDTARRLLCFTTAGRDHYAERRPK